MTKPGRRFAPRIDRTGLDGLATLDHHLDLDLLYRFSVFPVLTQDDLEINLGWTDSSSCSEDSDSD